MMGFNFYYEMADNIVYDEVKGDIRVMERKELEYFEKYGKVLDKNRIPSGNRCNNENECCPYCVGDCCLLYGGRMITSQGAYGFGFQHRKDQCVKDYPKGKDVFQTEVKDDEKLD